MSFSSCVQGTSYVRHQQIDLLRLRKIDSVLKLDRLYEQLAPLYSHTERPSINPQLMIRILLAG
jgi:hypothetical protein